MKLTDSRFFPPDTLDFGQPLALIGDCHQRMENHCDLLRQIADRLENGGLGLEDATSAQGIHKYFSKYAPLHQQDEEESLFPRLVRQSLKLAEIVHRLKGDHQQQDQLWRELGPQLARINSVQEIAPFVTLCNRFCDALTAHQRDEDENLLLIAQHIFSSREFATIGAEMAARRGKR
ncbi:MAG: hemerythrin domain-containing protein [Gammaproteobacteria bacterium]|nr:hemerythrin domain-containing protein [Gammaproteobacteria bacterium]